ncbi:MAG: HAMP domain-containing sensor histidine kinase [Candidatus Moranbacteria bacterium]|nr:HAMP domain-containing sensor histidine kinase [Candidatus Moranbacteria bacterium]
MDFNLVTKLESCFTFVSQNADFLKFVYYSHVPTAILSLLIGFFVYFKNKKDLVAKILFAITIAFSLWSFFDLAIWTRYDSRVLMFSWSLLGILDLLIFTLCLYFVYVYIDKKDISVGKKIVFILLFLPLVVLTPSHLNLSGFDVANCEAKEGQYFTNYYYLVGLGIFFWILAVIIDRYKKAPKGNRKQILLLAVGVELFLFSFFITGYLSSAIDNFNLEVYGLFGMTIFMSFLAYLIVQYHAFKIKLIGAQALVVSLVALVGSQFFFAQNMTSNVLTGVTLVLVGGIGIALIRSVKQEVERKEELQLMASKLAQANDSLRKLDNAKTEFISIASHQLRTPITAIKGFSSLLLEGSYGEVSESVHGALNKIYISTERLTNLIEDLLNVSRIESGRMTFSFKAASIKELLGELRDNFLLIAKNKQFYLDLKLPETPLPEIVMDGAKIRELVSNFIDNALKYTEKGGVTVRVEIRNEGVVVDENGFVIPEKKSEFGKVVRITVSDTGIGIPKEEIPYLFKKFSRGKDVSRLHVGGTGLGLFVGKAIAEAHHGQIWVESDGAGQGSKFMIEIPVVHVA